MKKGKSCYVYSKNHVGVLHVRESYYEKNKNAKK